MGLYDKGPYGRIRSIKPKTTNAGSHIAARIARIILPKTGAHIFDKIRKAQVKAYGEKWAEKTDPRNHFKAAADPVKVGPNSNKVLKKREELTDRTRSTVLQMLGSNNASSYLPNLVSRRPGIASSPQEQMAAAVEERATGSSSNTVYVDDQGFPVTLNQILGSQLLSPAQLKAASIQNVESLVKFNGGTSVQRQEALYMTQRMMLEGYIRGVDIQKAIQQQNGLVFDFASSGLVGGSILGSTGGNRTTFNSSWWDSHSDADKYTLFLHEVGHNVLDATHESTNKQKNPNTIMTALYAGDVADGHGGGYTALMNELFSSKEIHRAGILDTNNIYHGSATYDKSWFPSLTGSPTPGYDPLGSGSKGSGSSGGVQTQTNMFSYFGSPTVNPNINVMSVGQGGGANGSIGAPMNRATPVDASDDKQLLPPEQMSDDVSKSTKSFVAGLQQLSGNDSSEAGALLASG